MIKAGVSLAGSDAPLSTRVAGIFVID